MFLAFRYHYKDETIWCVIYWYIRLFFCCCDKRNHDQRKTELIWDYISLWRVGGGMRSVCMWGVAAGSQSWKLEDHICQLQTGSGESQLEVG